MAHNENLNSNFEQNSAEKFSRKDRPTFPGRAVVTAGMPYGNKGLHFGHVGGVFVPADFYARFLRDLLGPENVLFVSGTDCFGSPIMEGFRRQQESGFSGTIEDYVKKNHRSQLETLKDFHISCDVFSGSGLAPAAGVHQELTNEVITALFENGCLTKRSTLQFYDTEAKTFLNGRQVQGRCPIPGCKSEKAYADECDLGHQFDPRDLIKPVSQLTQTTPELRPVENWYYNLPAAETYLKKLEASWEGDPQIRAVVVKTLKEWLVAPELFIKLEAAEAFRSVADKLPAHKVHDPRGNAQSFSVEFENWQERDKAREVLEAANIFYRASKCLLPFRITGNIPWGVKAPTLAGLSDLTVWCWPESLWAPISFTKTALEKGAELAKAGDTLNAENAIDTPGRFSSTDWRDWWTGPDSEDAADADAADAPSTQVFQFIGQDNIYFYCIAQPALWDALRWNLFPDTAVANYHVLFMNKKASSSGAIKPPLAEEMLSFYTPEQLRYHWLSFALGEKSVSFAPKVFDTSVSSVDKKTGQEILVKDDPRVADPALKESAFLTNIFNRLARSCFYGAQNALGGHVPSLEPSEDAKELAQSAAFEFLCAMHDLNLHTALSVAENFGRESNKNWDRASKDAVQNADDSAYEQALADAFYSLHVLALCFHGAVPAGCEKIRAYLGISAPVFWNWDHVALTVKELLEKDGKDVASYQFKELPPRTDFFEKHESQYKK